MTPRYAPTILARLITPLAIAFATGACADEPRGPDHPPTVILEPVTVQTAPTTRLCTLPFVACDDRNACTLDDRCTPDGYCVGTWRDCDDGVACTDERCHPATGACEVDTWACECTAGEHCDDLEPCTVDACDLDLLTCRHTPLPADADCDDGDPCTEQTQCGADNRCGGGDRICAEG